MTIKEFIEKAIDGGWKRTNYYSEHLLYDTPIILLDPKAWEAVGKVEGWKETHHKKCPTLKYNQETLNDVSASFEAKNWIDKKCDCLKYEDWEFKHKMHKMIDHVINGGTIESYLKTL